MLAIQPITRSLSEVTTFKLGGVCHAFYDCKNEAELVTTITHLRKEEREFVLMGGGSNFVASPEPLPFAVVRFLDPNKGARFEGNQVYIPASAPLDQTVLNTVEEGISDLVFLSGIPGSVGGAVVGNAGAWGKDIFSVIDRIRVLTPGGRVLEKKASEVPHAYRESAFKKNGDIVLGIVLRMHRGDSKQLQMERENILMQRKEKHPDLSRFPCAGSVFKNVAPQSSASRRQAAGYFLEQCGAKELVVGGAGIFPRHANIIIKQGAECTAKDVYVLQERMKRLVQTQFGITLKREIRFLGDLPGITKKTNGFY